VPFLGLVPMCYLLVSGKPRLEKVVLEPGMVEINVVRDKGRIVCRYPTQELTELIHERSRN